jgi:hypothetical protein
MFVAALSSIAKLWKQPRCPTTDEWIKKMWYIYQMEYYSTIKKNRKNEILLFTGKWMKLKSIMLRSKPVSEDKVSCFFSYVDDSSQYKYKHYHIYIYTAHVSNGGTVRVD